MSNSSSGNHIHIRPKLKVVVHPYTTFYMLNGERQLMVGESDSRYCARHIARYLKLPFFFSPDIGLVEVDEEPLFGGWRCSPVPVSVVTSALREHVRLVGLDYLRGDWSLHDIDLYDHFAKELAGTRAANHYFPQLQGVVFMGHTTSDCRVIKRSGFDRRSGLFAMARKPFHAANDETMAVAA